MAPAQNEPDSPQPAGGVIDEKEYHMGLVTYGGERKPAYDRFKQLLAAPAVVRASRAAGAPAPL
jgi:hypothetical protein